MFHSLYDTFKPPVLDIQQNTLECCLYAIGTFTVTIIGCLLLLIILRWLLKKFGVKIQENSSEYKFIKGHKFLTLGNFKNNKKLPNGSKWWVARGET